MARRSLEVYQAKRHFDRTSEPPGTVRESESGRSFVVQKHAARRLHYDFRLELDGVLLSWAIPKGPSLDPKERRLAMRTEDHPIEYGGFEGIIPKGEYGGGTVLLWDRGEWEPIEDPRKGLEKGNLHFELHGQRLRGRFRLVRTRETDAWLLIKGKDDAAREQGNVGGDEEESVVSGLTLAQIAKDPDRVWHSGEGKTSAPDVSSLAGAKRATLTKTMAPELATLVDKAPEGVRWLHEVKYDGYRILSRIDARSVRLTTRKNNDWTDRLPSIERVLRALPVRAAWLDGEIAVLDSKGKTDFGRLQNAIGPGRDTDVRYFVFDLLHLDGFDLRAVALIERKRVLRELLERGAAMEGRLRFSDHVVGRGPEFFSQVCALGLEGIVSKRAECPYTSRRTKNWLKIKCLGREEALIGGFTDPSGARSAFGALLLGQFQDAKLRYVGKVGTGFDERTLRELHARLAPLEIDEPPFVDPPRGAQVRGVHWVRPELVAEVAFAERTADGKLRHSSFVGIREDKRPREVRPERKKALRETTALVGGVRLSSAEKVLYPDLGLTKRDLAEYYEAIADHMLPHLAGRPLTLVRCPEGLSGQCFYQQHVYAGMPSAIHRVRAEKGELEHAYVRTLAGLVSLVQIGVLEIHTWGARADKLERPDQLVFDLDPGPDVPWSGVIEAALEVRARLTELGLKSFVKTTGGKGLHVVVPISRTRGWDVTKAFTHTLAKDLTAKKRERYTANMAKSKRRGKIFIDYVRNARSATAVCAYSTRALPGAPVSTPLRWDELKDEIRSDSFGVRDIPERLRALRGRDPWEGFFETRQSITRKVLEALQ